MRKLMVAIGCCMVCLMFMGCPSQPSDFWFSIENRSSEKIVTLFNLDMYRYPDTSVATILSGGPLRGATIPPNSNDMWYNTNHTLRDYYSMILSGVMSIYIFSKDTINKYSWTETLANGRILQRYDLSYKDIESLDFVIPYPPTEAMRDVKMWPRYKSVVE